MHFGQAVGTACATFAITNVDDAFVLVTFFAESTTSKTLTPLKITLGQYIGFTIIIIISMIGYGVSLVLPSEPIGFLGLLPILLGIWKLIGLFISKKEDDSESSSRIQALKSILKVSSITVMNGGDNIGTYIPLFSQVEGAEIAVYVVVYYIMLGLWCLAAFLMMKQKHILHLIQKYVGVLIPFLYMGLGVYIVVKSDCYPWSIEHIDDSISAHPGRSILAAVTAFVLLAVSIAMIWFKWSRRAASPTTDGEISPAGNHSPDAGIPLGDSRSNNPAAPPADEETTPAGDGSSTPVNKSHTNNTAVPPADEEITPARDVSPALLDDVHKRS